MINVCWHEGADGFAHAHGRSGYSCCTLLNQMFDHYACEHWSTFQNLPEDTKGAVIVIQGGNERNRVEEINRDAATLQWVIFIIIGDESRDFPLEQLAPHPNSRVWFQMPEPGVTQADRVFLIGCSRNTPKLAKITERRRFNWFFAGQDTHDRRHQCMAGLKRVTQPGILLQTPGFEQGLSVEFYFDFMNQAKVIPCPSGPGSPDTFRFAEALECGCVPLADGHTIRYSRGDYWQTVLGQSVPFPIVYDWSTLPQVMTETLADWDAITARCQDWWWVHKATFNLWLKEDLVCLV